MAMNMSRRQFSVPGAGTAAFAATLFGAQTAGAATRSNQSGGSAVQNIVLVHGAYADGSSWSRVVSAEPDGPSLRRDTLTTSERG